jgi:DNA polymerase III alpha subunit
MKDNTPQAVQSCHDLIRWLIPQLDKFPRNRRFTLGEKIEQSLIEVLSLLVEASYTKRGKARLLEHVNTRLTVIRHLWRLAYELNVIAQKQYHYGSQLLTELGQQAGGWLKQTSQ